MGTEWSVSSGFGGGASTKAPTGGGSSADRQSCGTGVFLVPPSSLQVQVVPTCQHIKAQLTRRRSSLTPGLHSTCITNTIANTACIETCSMPYLVDCHPSVASMCALSDLNTLPIGYWWDHWGLGNKFQILLSHGSGTLLLLLLPSHKTVAGLACYPSDNPSAIPGLVFVSHLAAH